MRAQSRNIRSEKWLGIFILLLPSLETRQEHEKQSKGDFKWHRTTESFPHESKRRVRWPSCAMREWREVTTCSAGWVISVTNEREQGANLVWHTRWDLYIHKQTKSTDINIQYAMKLEFASTERRKMSLTCCHTIRIAHRTRRAFNHRELLLGRKCSFGLEGSRFIATAPRLDYAKLSWNGSEGFMSGKKFAVEFELIRKIFFHFFSSTHKTAKWIFGFVSYFIWRASRFNELIGSRLRAFLVKCRFISNLNHESLNRKLVLMKRKKNVVTPPIPVSSQRNINFIGRKMLLSYWECPFMSMLFECNFA